MPNDERGPVKRWVDGAPGRGFDAHLGEVFREVPDEEPLSTSALASVGRRLARGRRRSSRWATLRSMPIVFAVLGGGAGVAFGEWVHPGFWHLRSWRLFAAPTAAETSVPAPRSSPSVRPVESETPRVEPANDDVDLPSDVVEPENRVSPRIPPAPKVQPNPPLKRRRDRARSPSNPRRCRRRFPSCDAITIPAPRSPCSTTTRRGSPTGCSGRSSRGAG